MQDAVYIRALRRALELKGGADTLAVHLGIPAAHIAIWQKGLAPIPSDIFLKIVDILVDHSTQEVLMQTHAALNAENAPR